MKHFRFDKKDMFLMHFVSPYELTNLPGFDTKSKDVGQLLCSAVEDRKRFPPEEEEEQGKQ